MLKTPSFWYGEPTFMQRILQPLSALYLIAHKRQQAFADPYKATMPVICVGNITAGGSGKTPTALAIMALIKAQNIAQNPCFLTRGYGGDERGPLRVDAQKHTSDAIGDEALLLAKAAPTIVSADRAMGAKMAEDDGFDLIIMDDGFQNQQLFKDLNLLVINGEMGFGNGKLLPAGPLRGSLDDALAAADACVLIGEDKRGVTAQIPPEKPLFGAALSPQANIDKAAPYIAFAGLGYPEKFFSFLRNECGLNIISGLSYPDHHPYTPRDMEDLSEKAKALGAQLITTEKDMIRIPEPYAEKITTLPVSLEFSKPQGLVSMLESLIS